MKNPNKIKMTKILCETVTVSPYTSAQKNIVCSGVIEGRRIHRVYTGYTKKNALKDFKANPPK